MTDQQSFPLTDRQSDQIIAISAGGEQRVDNFIAQAVALSRQLPDRQYVINLCANRYQYLLGFCASVIAGQCTLMPPNRQMQTQALLSQDYPDSYTLGESEENDYQITGNDICSHGCSVVPEIPADQLCAIAFTSGSTGASMPNMKYWETLRTGSISNATLLMGQFAGPINLLATVPPQHMWGFETSILLPLFSDAAISHLNPFYPQDIVDALESLPGPRVLISSPVHLDALLKSGVRLAKIDQVFTATAPLSKQLAEDLETRFGTKVIDVFGCSESGILAARNASTEVIWKLAAAFELEVTKDGVVIRAQHLPGKVVLPDIVELIDEQHFRWLGRHHDVVNIAGKRGSLTDLNHRIKAIPGVVDGVIFMPDSTATRLAAMVVAPDLKPSDIRAALKSQIEPVFLPRPVFIVSVLPRLETGKLPIKRVVELFQETRKAKLLEKMDGKGKSG